MLGLFYQWRTADRRLRAKVSVVAVHCNVLMLV